MKPIHMLAIAGVLAPTLAHIADCTFNTTVPDSGDSCAAESSRNMLTSRGSSDGKTDGNPNFQGLDDVLIATGGQTYDWVCKSYDTNLSCGPEGEKLTHEMCSAMCRCHLPATKGLEGKNECIPWGSCDQKTLQDKCKCWGVQKVDQKVVCGKGPVDYPPFPSTTTKRPAATRINRILKPVKDIEWVN